MEAQTVLALIPARGGSKGLPGKNILPLHGKPLIAWSVEAALACPELDRTIVSSDDAQIIEVARTLGCEVPFVRPAHLATDQASSMDVILHALDSLPEHYAWVVVLQPTSPLRLAEDITACLQICLTHHAPACVSVVPGKSPYWSYFLRKDHGMDPILGKDKTQTGRQQLPPAYTLNGAVYVARTDWLREHRTFVTRATRAFVMPTQRSVDVDTAVEFKLAELLLAERTVAARLQGHTKTVGSAHTRQGPHSEDHPPGPPNETPPGPPTRKPGTP